jgi:AcrR family transcriptional regulator
LPGAAAPIYHAIKKSIDRRPVQASWTRREGLTIEGRNFRNPVLDRPDPEPAEAPAATGGAAADRRTRLSPELRKQEVLAGAIDYFAAQGFDGGTRGLARSTGITQPLLYRYFPSKDDLINEVYRAVFLDRWQAGWETTIARSDRPLKDRLTAFYHSYAATVLDRTWLRIFFFAGLKGLDLNRRYLQRVEERLLAPIWAETCRSLNLVTQDQSRPHDLVWQMHGAVFYHGIRRHIYGDESVRIGAAVDLAIATFLHEAQQLAGQPRAEGA